VPQVFVAWDGCARCSTDGGLDLSSTAFGEVFGEKRCGEGSIKGEITWELDSEVVWDSTGKLVGPAPGSVKTS